MNASGDRIGRILIDTAAYYALADPRDDNHPAARAVAERVAREGGRLFTTNYVVAETHALMLHKLGYVTARAFLDQIDRGSTTVIRVSSTDERRAREIISQYSDKSFSLADATSFAFMERLRISYAFTFDRHFAHYGFVLLIG